MRRFYLIFGLSILISSCSSSIVGESGTPTTSSTSVIAQLPSTTTVVEIEIPSELDFVALTTGGDLVNGSDLLLNPNNSDSTGDLSESENGYGQDILLWFWAPN